MVIDTLMYGVDDELGMLRRQLEEKRTHIERTEEKLARLGDALSLLGPDPQRNIDLLVETVAVVIGGASSLYNRLDEDRRYLCTWSIFHPPPEYVREDPAAGHICFEATMKSDREATILPDLTGTIWEECDSVVKKFGLKSYLGFPVKHRGKVVGSLCLVDTHARSFEPVDVFVLNALAKAMAIEEERKQTEEELEARLATIERQERALRALNDTTPPRA